MTGAPTWTYRPLERSDLEMLTRWLEEPAVARWWAHDTSPDAIEADFGPSIRGEEPTEVWIAQLDGRPVGLIQRYWLDDYPDDKAELALAHPIPPDAFSVDYFIGDGELHGRGLGPTMIDRFVTDTFDAWPTATAAIVAVHADNRPSWRALERAGFRVLGPVDLEPDNPIDDRRHVLTRRDR